MKLSALKTDPRVDLGAWVRDIPGLPGLALKVRPIDCIDAQRVMRRELQAIPRAKRLTGIDPADERAATNLVLRKVVLLDWSGLEDDDGAPIPYSPGMAERLIQEPEFAVFRDAVVYAAGIVRDEGKIALEEASGN